MVDPSNKISDSNNAPAYSRGTRRFGIPLLIIAVIIAVVFATFMIVRGLAKPYDRTHRTYVNFTVEEDSALDDIAGLLQEEGLVSSSSDFSTVSRLMFMTDFKPGTYFLSPSMTSVEIARTMSRGLTINSGEGFTIPAGYTIDQIATSLDRDGFADKDAFLRAAASDELKDIDFISGKIRGADQVEGFLFPGDYSIDPDADESMMIIAMINEFSNFFNEDYRARADELDLSIREIVTIASMIENETDISREKPRISSVIHNRINLGMTDLPQFPLCSPGSESIIAALYPEDSEDIYYTLSSSLNGSHVFAADEEEYDILRDAYERAVAARDQAAADEQQEEDEK